VEVLASRNFQDEETGSITVAFEDDGQRVMGLNVWAAARTKWVAAERPAVAARRLFEEIHALWSAMQREGDRTELVLGDGVLEASAALIRHPVLLQRVNLTHARRNAVRSSKFAVIPWQRAKSNAASRGWLPMSPQAERQEAG